MGFLEFIIRKIRGSQFDDGYIIEQIASDVSRIGSDELAIHYVENFSPSKLGRMGFIGFRKLAQIRRDHPEIWRKWMEEFRQ